MITESFEINLSSININIQPDSIEDYLKHILTKKNTNITKFIFYLIQDATPYLNNKLSEKTCNKIFSVIESEEFFNIDNKEKIKLKNDIRRINGEKSFNPEKQKSEVCKRWSIVIKLAILTMAINS